MLSHPRLFLERNLADDNLECGFYGVYIVGNFHVRLVEVSFESFGELCKFLMLKFQNAYIEN